MPHLKFGHYAVAALTPLLAAGLYCLKKAGEPLRIAAGDIPLPGMPWYPLPEQTLALIKDLASQPTPGIGALETWLRQDFALIGLLGLLFACAASTGWRQSGAMRAAAITLVLGVVAVLADVAENVLLLRLIESTAHPPPLAEWAARATLVKWPMLLAATASAVYTLWRSLGSPRQWGLAFFQDAPYIIDSATRRFDFNLHREFDYDPAGKALSYRPARFKPIFWAHTLLVLVIALGFTPDALCSVLSPGAAAAALFGLTALFAWLTYRCVRWYLAGVRDRLSRMDARNPAGTQDRAGRRTVLWAAMALCGFVVLTPLLLGIVLSVRLAVDVPCGSLVQTPGSASATGVALALCGVAIVMSVFSLGRSLSSQRLLYVQMGALIALCGVVWTFVAPDTAVEASNRPYRHLGAWLISAFALVLCAAPWIARRCFRRVHPTSITHFRQSLATTELFDGGREFPTISRVTVVQAVINGTLYHPLRTLLLPCLLSLVVPADWVTTVFSLTLLLSVLLMTWASLSKRWAQLAGLIERWLLSGMTFPVSLFVVVLSLLRLLGVHYVAIILDAAPLGASAMWILTAYFLAWTVDYWINRIAATELLSILGATPGTVGLAYPFEAEPTDKVKVARDGRHLMSHGLGRVMVVGRPATANENDGRPRFHSYNLLGVFALLDRDQGRPHLAAVSRVANAYFYWMNVLIIAAVCTLVGMYLYWAAPDSTAAALDTTAGSDALAPYDLAEHLIATGDGRPAVIVAASGGGTRAALYATHVLHGLHRLGIDRDIVLVSGVSGGGVALSYFATHFDALASGGSDHWDTFRASVSRPFIEDVIEGAAEWRVFTGGSLTRLLTESLRRGLFCAGKAETCIEPKLGEVNRVGLILNTAVTGHPAEESAVLATALTPPADSDCSAQMQPFALMSGGRLIFTNLKAVEAFNHAATIPDVRLPYEVLRDPGIPLATAAALNANFPPVFQNAKVIVRDARAGAACPSRAYFVTDGGAEENLGLVSALLAVRGALDGLQGECALKRDDCRALRGLRPLHFVLAEASAVGVDYQQDRGISAAIGNAKERLTGGLTQLLIDDIRRRLEVLGALAGSSATAQHYHYLPLPLPFRSRGGIGTHWMQADRYELSDPRARSVASAWEQLKHPSVQRKATLDRVALCRTWDALHRPESDFCDPARRPQDESSARVHRWVCAPSAVTTPKADPHVQAWSKLTSALRTSHRDPGGFQCRQR